MQYLQMTTKRPSTCRNKILYMQSINKTDTLSIQTFRLYIYIHHFIIYLFHVFLKIKLQFDHCDATTVQHADGRGRIFLFVVFAYR